MLSSESLRTIANDKINPLNELSSDKTMLTRIAYHHSIIH